MYSTCTFSVEENEGVIDRFLEENPDFELEDANVNFGRPTLEYARRIFRWTAARDILPQD